MARLRPGLPSAFCWACGGELGSSSVVVPGPAHARLSYSDSQPPCRLRPPCVALAEGGTTLGSAASSPRVQQASWGQHGDGARSEALSSRPPASSRLVGIDQFTGRRSESLIHSQLAKPSKHAGTRRPEEEMLEAGLATQPYLQDLNVVSAPCLRCGALNGPGPRTRRAFAGCIWRGVCRRASRRGRHVVLCVCVLISLIVLLGFNLLLPHLVDADSMLAPASLRHCGLTLALTLGVIFHYAATCLTSPGFGSGTSASPEIRKLLATTNAWRRGGAFDEKDVQAALEGLYASRGPQHLQGWSLCGVTGLPMPPRSHYCRTCYQIVLVMDHHCMFTNGCIGHRNHHYYISFLIYTATACAYVLAATMYVFCSPAASFARQDEASSRAGVVAVANGDATSLAAAATAMRSHGAIGLPADELTDANKSLEWTAHFGDIAALGARIHVTPSWWRDPHSNELENRDDLPKAHRIFGGWKGGSPIASSPLAALILGSVPLGGPLIIELWLSAVNNHGGAGACRLLVLGMLGVVAAGVLAFTGTLLVVQLRNLQRGETYIESCNAHPRAYLRVPSAFSDSRQVAVIGDNGREASSRHVDYQLEHLNRRVHTRFVQGQPPPISDAPSQMSHVNTPNHGELSSLCGRDVGLRSLHGRAACDYRQMRPATCWIMLSSVVKAIVCRIRTHAPLAVLLIMRLAPIPRQAEGTGEEPATPFAHHRIQ